jgi:hypothetical protein
MLHKAAIWIPFRLRTQPLKLLIRNWTGLKVVHVIHHENKIWISISLLVAAKQVLGGRE